MSKKRDRTPHNAAAVRDRIAAAKTEHALDELEKRNAAVDAIRAAREAGVPLAAPAQVEHALDEEENEREPKHTPGPWIVSGPHRNGWDLSGKTDNLTGPVVTQFIGTIGREADAHLASRAPVLLKANTDLLARVRELEEIGWHLASLCNECGGSGRATEELEDETPCPDCGPARAALARSGAPTARK